MKLIKPNTIVIHHSASLQTQNVDDAVKRISRSHRQRGLHTKPNKLDLYVAYHFIIGAKGEVRNTRGLDEVGWHCGNFYLNLRSFGICLLGNFQKDLPTEEQLMSLQNITASLQRDYPINRIIGHRSVKATACPGKNFTDIMIAQIANGDYDESVPDWAKEEWEDATKKGIVNGRRPNDIITHVEMEFVLKRMKGVTKTGEPMTRARFIKALYNMKK